MILFYLYFYVFTFSNVRYSASNILLCILTIYCVYYDKENATYLDAINNIFIQVEHRLSSFGCIPTIIDTHIINAHKFSYCKIPFAYYI